MPTAEDSRQRVDASAADQIARLRHALEVARHLIEGERMVVHAIHGSNAIRGYDDTLSVINSALKFGTTCPESEGGEA